MVPMPKPKVPAQVQDFTALPLQLPARPAYQKEAAHYLYLRQNVPRIPTNETPRELFLVNVPIDATVKSLRQLFAEHLGGGRVEEVEFEDAQVGKGKGIKAPVVRSEGKKSKKRKRAAEGTTAAIGDEAGEEVGLLPETWDRDLHRSGGTAVVRFVDQTSAQLALREAKKAAKTGKRIPWPPNPDDPPLGSARYRAHHTLRYPDLGTLQSSTDAYMTAFSAKEAETARQLARQRMEPDADGFITVVRGGRNGPARPRPEEADGGEDAVEKRKKKHKGNVEEGFYRFQVRERKKREHGELARKFEEDARRVEEMRTRRGRVRPE